MACASFLLLSSAAVWKAYCTQMRFDLAALAAGVAVWPGVYLLAGGCAKAFDPPRGRDTIVTRVLPRWAPVLAAWWTLAGVELGIGALVVSDVATPVPECAAAAVLAVAALGAGWGLRHAPDAGCGCFGARSVTQVSTLTVARAALLSALALASALVGQGWTHVLARPGAALVCLALGVALWRVTPELREVVWRLGSLRSAYAGTVGRLRDAACARREVSVERLVAQLRASALWNEAQRFLSQDAPSEHWQEGCRGYLCYPASFEGDAVTAVFTLYVGRGGGASGVAFVDEESRRVFATIAGEPGRW